VGGAVAAIYKEGFVFKTLRITQFGGFLVNLTIVMFYVLEGY